MSVYRRILWGTILILSSLVTTISSVWAEIKEQNFILNSDGTKSFETLIQSAQNLAKESIEQQFTHNPALTEVSITILSEHNGQIVPLLHSKVSRSQWQRDSRIYRWTKYFGSSGVLLGFYGPSASSTPQVTPGSVITPSRVRKEDEPGFRDD